MAEEMERPSAEHLARSVDDLYFSALLEKDLVAAFGDQHTPVPEHGGEEISPVSPKGDLLPPASGEKHPLLASGEEISSVLAKEDLLPASGEKHTLPESGEEISPVLDENYASLLQFQEVLVSSAQAATTAAASANSSQDYPHQPGCYCNMAASVLPETTVMAGDPSCKRTFCDICAEAKPLSEMFQNQICSHVFCKECVGRHIAIHVRENITAVKCLAGDCGAALEPEQCRQIIPPEVFDTWGAALCEAMLLGWRRFYCPFQDCSAPLLDDGGEAVRESECPHCHRLFCAQCGVPWHAGVECEEFQNLGADERGGQDLMLLDLAKNKNWKRCPKCRFYVEKGEGCLHITCRCGFQFCYGCGSTWGDAHTSCHT